MNEFQKAFRKARNGGERFFYFKGSKYNTMTGSEVKSGETQSRQSKKSEQILSSIESKGPSKISTDSGSMSLMETSSETKQDKKEKKKDPRYKRRIKRILDRGEKKESRQKEREEKRKCENVNLDS